MRIAVGLLAVGRAGCGAGSMASHVAHIAPARPAPAPMRANIRIVDFPCRARTLRVRAGIA